VLVHSKQSFYLLPWHDFRVQVLLHRHPWGVGGWHALMRDVHPLLLRDALQVGCDLHPAKDEVYALRVMFVLAEHIHATRFTFQLINTGLP